LNEELNEELSEVLNEELKEKIKSGKKVNAPSRWEKYYGGSVEAEIDSFKKLSKDILNVQHRHKVRSKAQNIDRALHAKSLLAVENAKLVVAKDLPEDLQVRDWKRGAEFDVVVRFSNAKGFHQSDSKKDLRGVALRLKIREEIQDLLMTNFPVSHAEDAVQFVKVAKAMSGNFISRILGGLNLIVYYGIFEVLRMLINILRGRFKGKVSSLATETFWSRGAMLWGEAGPVRFRLCGMEQSNSNGSSDASTDEYLSKEIGERLLNGSVEWELRVQRYIDDDKTPVENAAREWPEEPSVLVATLSIPKQDINSIENQATAKKIEELSFNPWNTIDDFRPLGNLNRARQAVYKASFAHRSETQFCEPIPLRNRIVGWLLEKLFSGLNWAGVQWHKLPTTNISILNLIVFRNQLRRNNLIETDYDDVSSQSEQPNSSIPEEYREWRTFDGSYNDLSSPNMGKAGTAFGRNMRSEFQPDNLNTPSPIIVADHLLKRESFIPAKSLNVLAAAWVQFQVHDWMSHCRHQLGPNDIVVPIPDGYKWKDVTSNKEVSEMRIAGDREYPANSSGGIVFRNKFSHWWDASQLYGPDKQKAESLLKGPRISLDNGYLPTNDRSQEVAGVSEGWWLGLSAMHTIFAREHNTVVEALSKEYPGWDDFRTYQTARLIISALIAKIHTVEWTPAILATPEIDIALNSNWSGPAGLWTRIVAWLSDVHALRGIPDTSPDHHSAPYSITEEFVSVYRMHPLIPDDYSFYDPKNGQPVKTMQFNDLEGDKTDEAMQDLGLETTLYSLGISHPGAITLHNYPSALRNYCRINEYGKTECVDLAVVDLMRDRSRGIPRYNQFCQNLRKKPITRWEDLTKDPEDIRLLREIYGSIDQVDTMVGLFAETPPKGFGFSDTAFRIFILMATRRIQSDRFLTVDFRPEIYSPLGIDWVQNNTMSSVILRHAPELAAVVPRNHSAFAPWRRLQNGGS